MQPTEFRFYESSPELCLKPQAGDKRIQGGRFTPLFKNAPLNYLNIGVKHLLSRKTLNEDFWLPPEYPVKYDPQGMVFFVL